MLDYAGLVKLEKSLRNGMVLSVYVDGELQDPAERRRWRMDLRHELDAIAKRLESASHTERESFAACRLALVDQLAGFTGAIGAAGWVGFFGVDGMYHASMLPVEVPTLAVWSAGAVVAPYLRVLKETRPVIVAIVDAKKARLFRYVGGEVTRLATLRAHTLVDEPSHMGAPSKVGFHSGTRGRAGTDAAQRERREGTAHLLGELASALTSEAGADGWIIIGGIPSVADAALQALPDELSLRAQRVELDVHATDAQVATCARSAASELRAALDLDRLTRVIHAAERFGPGEIETTEIERALREGRVQELYLSLRYLTDHPDDTEEVVRLAFDSRAVVEEVSGPAGARLDEVGGLAARLRYVQAAGPSFAPAVSSG